MSSLILFPGANNLHKVLKQSPGQAYLLEKIDIAFVIFNRYYHEVTTRMLKNLVW